MDRIWVLLGLPICLKPEILAIDARCVMGPAEQGVPALKELAKPYVISEFSL